VADITQDSMRTAFAAYARDHEAAPRIHDNRATLRRCRGHRNPERRSTKSAVRNDLSRESQPRSGF
jgi:hypothetical protein